MVFQLALALNLDFIACQDLEDSKQQVCYCFEPQPLGSHGAARWVGEL